MVNSTMMRGVVYTGALYNMTVQDLPRPHLIDETDVIVRITTSGICGSDLHQYHGIVGNNAVVPYTMGHEAVGYVDEAGSAVQSLSVGDYVIISATASVAHFALEPEQGNFYGNGIGLDGLQAEYARVPYGDLNTVAIPLTRNNTNQTLEQSYLTVSDIFATGWRGLTWTNFVPGDTVAVFGAGPVGQLAVYSAKLRGASRIYVVDHVQTRLDLAATHGAIPINFVQSDPVEQILAYEPDGVMRSVDCVGMEALNAQLEHEQHIVISQMVEVTHIHGGIGVPGLYSAVESYEAAPRGSTISPNITFPLTDFWNKRLSLAGGPVDNKLVAAELVSLISSGVADPSFISSATISVEEAPEYYARLNRSEEMKVYISFP